MTEMLSREQVQKLADQVGYDLPLSQNQWSALFKFLKLLAQQVSESKQR